MQPGLKKFLSTIIPLGLGLFLIWYMFHKLEPEDIIEIKTAFRKTNYFFIFLSLLFALLSHLSRAYRWKFLLEPLGIKPKFYNSFFGVMIGYAANMLVPRMGEASRCVYVAKYEKQSFEKLFGTVLAERVIDLIVLALIMLFTVFLQFDILEGYLVKVGFFEKFKGLKLYLIIGLSGLTFFVFWRLIKTSSNKFFVKIRSFLTGILEGLKTVFLMKKKGLFLLHTFFIWILYIAMFYIAFYSLPGVSKVPFGGIISAFIIGSLSIVATNGGIGAYPLGIQQILLLYDINANEGLAFGWIVWIAQSAMIIFFGILSVVLMPIFNRKNEQYT